MVLRLAYLGVTNAIAMFRLLPVGDRAKDIEILALRHQISVLQRQLHGQRPRLAPADRAWLAALLHRLPRNVLGRLRLLVRPDTVLRWHRDLVAGRHAKISRPNRGGRPPTVRSIRALVLRLARENDSWGYRRIHGELLTLGVKVAASTVWEILKEAGIDPAPQRTCSSWSTFLRSQAEAIIAVDFFETVTLTGARMYVLAAIEHATCRVRILGATAVSRTGFDGDIETWEEHQRCPHRRSTPTTCVSVRPGWRLRPAGTRPARPERSGGSPASSRSILRRCARG